MAATALLIASTLWAAPPQETQWKVLLEVTDKAKTLHGMIRQIAYERTPERLDWSGHWAVLDFKIPEGHKIGFFRDCRVGVVKDGQIVWSQEMFMPLTLNHTKILDCRAQTTAYSADTMELNHGWARLYLVFDEPVPRKDAVLQFDGIELQKRQ